MPLLERLKSIFSASNTSVESRRKSKAYNYIKRDEDPSEIWKIVGELGDGSFGKVYKTQHKQTGIFAALKQVEINEETDLDDFSVEIDILTECKHCNIVGLHEAFYFNGKLLMYIEFCAGGAVDSIMLDLERHLSEPEIRCICRQMCEALQFLHRNMVIHRDLKAGNVLLTAEGCVKLADFGVSAKNSSSRQKRDSFIGTPYWMAPEVIACETLKDNPYDVRADIWSLGITLIEFAQMEPPNHEMHPMRVLIKIQKAAPPFLDQPSKWSSEFNDFLGKCLVKDPELRLSATDLLEHKFLSNVTDIRPICELLQEAKAEVTVETKDIDECELQEDMRIDSQSSDFDLDDISNVSSSEPETCKHEATAFCQLCVVTPARTSSDTEIVHHVVTPEYTACDMYTVHENSSDSLVVGNHQRNLVAVELTCNRTSDELDESVLSERGVNAAACNLPTEGVDHQLDQFEVGDVESNIEVHAAPLISNICITAQESHVCAYNNAACITQSHNCASHWDVSTTERTETIASVSDYDVSAIESHTFASINDVTVSSLNESNNAAREHISAEIHASSYDVNPADCLVSTESQFSPLGFGVNSAQTFGAVRTWNGDNNLIFTSSVASLEKNSTNTSSKDDKLVEEANIELPPRDGNVMDETNIESASGDVNLLEETGIKSSSISINLMNEASMESASGYVNQIEENNKEPTSSGVDRLEGTTIESTSRGVNLMKETSMESASIDVNLYDKTEMNSAAGDVNLLEETNIKSSSNNVNSMDEAYMESSSGDVNLMEETYKESTSSGMDQSKKTTIESTSRDVNLMEETSIKTAGCRLNLMEKPNIESPCNNMNQMEETSVESAPSSVNQLQIYTIESTSNGVNLVEETSVDWTASGVNLVEESTSGMNQMDDTGIESAYNGVEQMEEITVRSASSDTKQMEETCVPSSSDVNFLEEAPDDSTSSLLDDVDEITQVLNFLDESIGFDMTDSLVSLQNCVSLPCLSEEGLEANMLELSDAVMRSVESNSVVLADCVLTRVESLEVTGSCEDIVLCSGKPDLIQSTLLSGDSEVSSSSSQKGISGLVNDEKLIDEILLLAVDSVIDEVVNSTHRQPSIPGIVCEVITEIIRSDNVGASAEDVAKVTEPKKQSVTEAQKKKILEETQQAVMDVTADEGDSLTRSNLKSGSTVLTVKNGRIVNNGQRISAAKAPKSAPHISTSINEPVPSDALSVSSKTAGSEPSTVTKQDNKNHYRTLTKTRKYVNVDGELVTSQTSTIVITGEENKKQQEHELWKADLRELKLLQKVENKQHQDLILKAQYLTDQQARKFEQDMQAVLKTYESAIEELNRNQKSLVEKAEQSQAIECKGFSRKLKIEQEKDLKLFHEDMRNELRKLKDEGTSVPKEHRKEAMKRRREEKEIEQAERVRKFMEQQQENSEKAFKRLTDQHRNKISQLERESLRLKHQLLRAREAAIWELEEQHLNEKTTLAKRQLKDLFFLKRHQMMTRHHKEMDQCCRSNTRTEEEMIRRHALEKKRQPKNLKDEMKTRSIMFKESLRISQSPLTSDQEREKIKQFEDQEKRRYKTMQQRLELKHQNQLDELERKNALAVRELEHIQNEKCKMILDHETQKLNELDESYQTEIKEWKQNLRIRKQKLEEEFDRQLRDQEQFYGCNIGTTTTTYIADETGTLSTPSGKQQRSSIVF